MSEVLQPAFGAVRQTDLFDVGNYRPAALSWERLDIRRFRSLMSAVPVNVDNFVRAETNRMFANLLAGAGDSPWLHFRGARPA